ncbi:MAG: hypothetical protein LBN99_00185 [Oscillospiraceae bacterium]|jgi:hypothetical protein|nr:hypothetical protein [Oscillospiraceae bacterium]
MDQVTLVNTAKYPFNNSVVTVALATEAKDAEYAVLTDLVDSDGEAGEIVVSDRAVNGFKLAFTGSGARATVRYVVVGG